MCIYNWKDELIMETIIYSKLISVFNRYNISEIWLGLSMYNIKYLRMSFNNL